MKKDTKINDIYAILIAAAIIIITSVIIIVCLTTNVNNSGNSSTTQVRQGSTNEEFTVYDNVGTKINISDVLKGTKEIEGLTLSNIQLTEDAGQTTLIAYVTNNTEQDIPEPFDVNLVLLDKEGQEIYKLPAIISSLKVGETKSLSASITEDLANAYDFRVERAE